jgi:hypothetical protein
MTEGAAPSGVAPVNIGDIVVRIADVLGIPKSALAINDITVHPVTAEIFISVSRIGNFESAPAIMKVSQDGQIVLMDRADVPFQKQALDHYPDQETTFRPRGLGKNPPQVRDTGKAIMFDGMSLQIAPLGDSLFVSLTRDM